MPVLKITFQITVISTSIQWMLLLRFAGDMNSKTPLTVASEENKLGIRFQSSSLFNFRGMKIQYLVSAYVDVH